MPAVSDGNLPPLLSVTRRRIYGFMLISVLLIILIGAAGIPFYFESSSILYQFGIKRTLLRSGQVIGLTAACLVILQSVLSTRIKFLDRIFALTNLMNAHRIGGIIIAGCALIHPTLVFLPENMTHIPFSFRYWPEYTGLFLMLMIAGIVGVALIRSKIGLAFHRWRIMHQWATFAATAALFVHVLYVSDSFKSGPPRSAAFFAMGCYALIFFRARIRPWLIRRHPLFVSDVSRVAEDAYRLKLRSKDGPGFSYLPGQFGFVSLKSANLSAEAHPFTIASAPSRPGFLEFVIRICGDWTRNIHRVKKKDLAFVDGPFGLFTHLRCSAHPELILIAGGIGITPMLSMLRFMADNGDLRKITLIWSNRTARHIIFADEFENLKKQLSGLRIFHIITEEPANKNQDKRLDRFALEDLLAGCTRSSALFVCGPPKMMKDMIKALIGIGFSRCNIFSERFGL